MRGQQLERRRGHERQPQGGHRRLAVALADLDRTVATWRCLVRSRPASAGRARRRGSGRTARQRGPATLGGLLGGPPDEGGEEREQGQGQHDDHAARPVDARTGSPPPAPARRTRDERGEEARDVRSRPRPRPWAARVVPHGRIRADVSAGRSSQAPSSRARNAPDTSTPAHAAIRSTRRPARPAAPNGHASQGDRSRSEVVPSTTAVTSAPTANAPHTVATPWSTPTTAEDRPPTGGPAEPPAAAAGRPASDAAPSVRPGCGARADPLAEHPVGPALVEQHDRREDQRHDGHDLQRVVGARRRSSVVSEYAGSRSTA